MSNQRAKPNHFHNELCDCTMVEFDATESCKCGAYEGSWHSPGVQGCRFEGRVKIRDTNPDRASERDEMTTVQWAHSLIDQIAATAYKQGLEEAAREAEKDCVLLDCELQQPRCHNCQLAQRIRNLPAPDPKDTTYLHMHRRVKENPGTEEARGPETYWPIRDRE